MGGSNGRVPPHNSDAEASLLGAMLLDPVAVDAVRDLGLTADDFYRPAHGHIYAAVAALTERDQRTDAVTVAEELRRSGLLGEVGGPGTLLDLQATTPAISRAASYARIVQDTALLRRIIGMAADVTEAAYGGFGYDDPSSRGQHLGELGGRLAAIADLASTGGAADVGSLLMSGDQWADVAFTDPRPWTIPGVLREMGRMMIVAPEGAGKSTLTRQIAVCAAAGLHPFRGWTQQYAYPAVRTLMVDLENDSRTAVDEDGTVDGGSASAIVGSVRKAFGGTWPAENLAVLERPEGMDIRSREGSRLLTAMVRDHGARLVIIAPIYKATSKHRGEDDEMVGSSIQRILDRIRVRHGCAFIMEHHAPNGSGGYRDMRPFGTSLWQRWPEIGLSLNRDPEDPSRLLVSRFRGDRYRVRGIPAVLERRVLADRPWAARWSL